MRTGFRRPGELFASSDGVRSTPAPESSAGAGNFKAFQYFLNLVRGRGVAQPDAVAGPPVAQSDELSLRWFVCFGNLNPQPQAEGWGDYLPWNGDFICGGHR